MVVVLALVWSSMADHWMGRDDVDDDGDDEAAIVAARTVEAIVVNVSESSSLADEGSQLSVGHRCNGDAALPNTGKWISSGSLSSSSSSSTEFDMTLCLSVKLTWKMVSATPPGEETTK